MRKDIDELLLQANMEKLKKAVAIMKINFDKKKDLQLCQLLKILQTHVDLLVVSDIKQILFHMMQAKKAAQQSKDKKNDTGAVGKGNLPADILGAVWFDSKISAFLKNSKIRGAIGEVG